MFRRRWNLWPGRFARELRSTGILLSLFGMILGLIAFIIYLMTSAIVLAWLGGLLLVISLFTVARSAIVSIPDVLRYPGDFRGKSVTDVELANMDPPLCKVGAVGIEQTGKSTLLNIVHKLGYPIERTTVFSQYVVEVPSSESAYAVWLDAGGFDFGPQLNVASQADYLFIMVDHNVGHTSQELDLERLQRHREFLRLLRGRISGRSQRIRWAHMLLNKRDLWQTMSSEDLNTLREFFSSEARSWESEKVVDRFTYEDYSNYLGEDTLKFNRQLSAFADGYRERR